MTAGTVPGGRDEAAGRPVLAIGETLIDLIVSDGSPDLTRATAFGARDGGAPANVAVALARLGVPSAFGGVVGDDAFGRRLRGVLNREGVDTSRLRATPEAPTSLAFAWKDARGDGHFSLLRLADRLLTNEDIDGFGVEGLAGLVVGSVALAAEPSRAAITHAVILAAAAGVPVVFDVNLRPSLWPDLTAAADACRPIIDRATVLKASLDDVRALLGAGDDPIVALRAIAALPPRIAVLTDGARGSYLLDESGQPHHVPAFPVEAVEPTGAGDAFTAALVSRLIERGWTAPDAADVRYASAAGALATTKAGAMEGLPRRAELDGFMGADRV